MSAAVPPGYKQTEVGVIPEDWRISTLGAICSFENGDRGSNYPSPGSFVSDGIPFINAGHIALGRINLREMDFITPEKFASLGRGKVRPGDILFCLRGTLGKYGVVGSEFGEGAIASSSVIVRPDGKNIIRQFLESYFASPYCSQMIEIWAGGAAQPNLGVQDLTRFTLSLPPIAEQRTIAEALSDADALIEGLEALIAKKRQLKQGAMQGLLTGKRRLFGYGSASAEYRETEVGIIPKDWDVKTIAETAPLQRGFDLPTSKIVPGIYPVVYSNGPLAQHEKAMVHGPGVVTGRSGTLGRVHYVQQNFWPHNTSLWVTNFFSNHPKYIFYLYSFVNFERFASGSGVPTLNRNDAHAFKLAVPPLVSEQQAIASVLSDMDAEIAVLEGKLAKARRVKAGMMQDLLTGRVRLI